MAYTPIDSALTRANKTVLDLTDVRVDLPTDDYHIANKLYVDQVTGRQEARALMVVKTARFSATANQLVFAGIPEYVIGANAVHVYVNGIKQPVSLAYNETSTTSITLTQSVSAGTVIEVVVFQTLDPAGVGLGQNGATALAALSDVDASSAIDGALLTFNGTTGKWVPVSGKYLPVAGGTLQGALILRQDPQTSMEAATKNYVDLKVAGIVTSSPSNPSSPSSPSSYVGDGTYISVNGSVISFNANTLNAMYASTAHTHSTYASLQHTHPDYALASHSHSNYASANHTHTKAQITDFAHRHNASDIDGLVTTAGTGSSSVAYVTGSPTYLQVNNTTSTISLDTNNVVALAGYSTIRWFTSQQPNAKVISQRTLPTSGSGPRQGGNTGFMQLPNGMMMQWGMVFGLSGASQATRSTTVTFETPFHSYGGGPFNVSITPVNAAGQQIGALNVTTTGMTISLGVADPDTRDAYWCVWGWWADPTALYNISDGWLSSHLS